MDYEDETYDISKAFASIENELIDSMMRNMDRHRAEETDMGFNWSMWQAEQLQALNEYKLRNSKKFNKKFSIINSKIEGIIRVARREGNMNQEGTLLRAVLHGRVFKQKDSLSGTFFKMNDRKMDALIKATTDDFKKGEYAMLRQTDDQYRKIIYNAQVYANSGAATYEKAIDMATKDFLSKGIQCIKYKNGATHNISEYADMCIRTATKRAYFVGEGEKRAEWGEYLVIMNKRGSGTNHTGSTVCPYCMVWAGKILIDDVWSGGSVEDGNYPLMSEAIAQGLYHPRCRDSHTTYFDDGFDEEYDKEKYGSEEQRENIFRYNAEQKHNNALRQIEKYKRLENFSLAKENRQRYKAREKEWEKAEKITRPTTKEITPTESMQKKDSKSQKLEDMSMDELRRRAKEEAVKYYKSGRSGITFGDRTPEEVAEILVNKGSKTSLIKDIKALIKKNNMSKTSRL